MAEVLGATLPSINITGFLSSTWLYVFLIMFIGAIGIVALVIFLYYKTWNKKIEFYENVSGAGYQRIGVRRARTIKLGIGGDEVLKPKGFFGYLTAYGQKMGRNIYWFAKGSDGYWYNVILGDLDGKRNMLDIEPIDRDARMFHVAMDRITVNQFGEKKNFMEKYASYILVFGFLVIMILGMWFIVGKIGDSTQALSETAETNTVVAELLSNILAGADNIATQQNIQSSSGLIPAGDAG